VAASTGPNELHDLLQALLLALQGVDCQPGFGPCLVATSDDLLPRRRAKLITGRSALDDSLVVLGRMVGQSTGVSPLAVTR
jgi:hypothetical protein